MFNAGSPFLGAVNPPTAATTASSVFPAFFPLAAAAISTPLPQHQQHHNLFHHHQQQLYREQSVAAAMAFYQQIFNGKLAAAAAAAVSPNGNNATATTTSQNFLPPNVLPPAVAGFTTLKQMHESGLKLSNNGVGPSSLVSNGPSTPTGNNKCPLCDQLVNFEDLNDHFMLELKKMDKIFDCFRSKLIIYNEASPSKMLRIMDPTSENRMKILSNIRHRKAERAKKRVPIYCPKSNVESRSNHISKTSVENLMQSCSTTGIDKHNCDIEQQSPMSDVSDKFNSKIQSPIRCKSSDDSPVHCRKCFKILVDLDESQTCRHVCSNCFEISQSKNSKSPCNQCLIIEKD